MILVHFLFFITECIMPDNVKKNEGLSTHESGVWAVSVWGFCRVPRSS